MKNCEECKFCDIDYIWNEENGEEYPIYTCQKGNDTDLDFECKDFKEYKPKPHKEKYTKCDKCNKLDACKKENRVLNCTKPNDTE